MKAIVTGGASFIGSHVVEKLVNKGYEVEILDDFSSGSLENVSWLGSKVKITPYNLLAHVPPSMFTGVDVVYHLAADHGGRGYVDTRQVACSSNFELDQKVLRACYQAKVPKVIFASSGCIYPIYKQQDVKELLYLREEDAGPPYDPDGLYGWAKMAAELTLEQMVEESEGGFKAASCRFFTVYGPRAKENHAIMAMIARTFVEQTPFEVWGDGSAIRNWTYVDDIAEGMVGCEEVLENESYYVVNLGTTERTTVKEAAEYIIGLGAEKTSFASSIKFLPNMPVGPLNRVADNSKMVREMEIIPVSFKDGVKKTLNWYYETKDKKYIEENLERLLIERK